jgi:DNA recombination protein RmuC
MSAVSELVLLVIATGCAVVAALFAFLCFLRTQQLPDALTAQGATQILRVETDIVRAAVEEQARGLRQELGNSLKGFQELTLAAFGTLRDGIDAQVRGFGERLDGGIKAIDERAAAISTKLNDEMAQMRSEANTNRETLRTLIEQKLDHSIGQQTEASKTLRDELGGNFQRLGSRVSESLIESSQLQKERLEKLEQVFRGIGEMQSLATGVGDLKKMLSNVKMRGAWGEVSLGSLLDQVLTADQYERNVEVKPGSNQRVEYAIKLPGGDDGDAPLWLPIDAKFPNEDYERPVDASDRGDVEAVEVASKAVEMRIRASAKEICEKYVHPPHSTDFAVLFLPTEGLFAEIIRRPGLVDALQRECRIVVTGPTTLMALLNSLRMGFRTLAIQKRSSEVWQVLGAVKTEFGKYGEVLDKVQQKLHEASNTIDKVSVRRRAIDRKLRGVEILPEMEAGAILSLSGGNGLDADDSADADN